MNLTTATILLLVSPAIIENNQKAINEQIVTVYLTKTAGLSRQTDSKPQLNYNYGKTEQKPSDYG